MQLIIRPKNRELAEVEVVDHGKIRKATAKKNISTSLLKYINKILNNRKPDRILVDVSEASFSAERLGLAIGKTLSWVWGIKLDNQN